MDLTVVIDNQFFDKYQAEFFAIYHEAFPDNERQADDVIRLRFKQDFYHFVCCFSDDNTLLGFALITEVGIKNCSFVEYFAVKEFFRQQGVGSHIIQKMLNICKLKNTHIILEVENPDFEPNTETKQKRIQFYSKNGFALINGFDYIMPALDGTQPTEMLFMCSNTERKRLKYEELIQLTNDIYSKVYFKDENDPNFIEIVEKNKVKKYYKIGQ